MMNSSDDVVRHQILSTLVEGCKNHPGEYLTLDKNEVDSSLVRQVVADLRIEGYIEEETRGVIRLTELGFSVYSHEAPVQCAGAGLSRLAC